VFVAVVCRMVRRKTGVKVFDKNSGNKIVIKYFFGGGRRGRERAWCF